MDVMSITTKESLADLVEKVGNSIVRIDAGHAWSGTGTVWDKGVVITAHHVIDRDEGIELGLPDGSTVAATPRRPRSRNRSRGPEDRGRPRTARVS